MSLDAAIAEPAEPWRSFRRDLDACLTGEVELICFGGFVVAQHYGLGRATSDIDFVDAIIESRADDLEHLAGMRSDLHRKYRLYRLINLEAFKRRYLDEVRPYMLGNFPWHDKTLELWLAIAS